jgi:hypothetical protein
VSVFLRWGVFGILAVAALIYAYNASKDLAGKRRLAAPVVTVPAEAPVPPEATATAGPAPASISGDCELEILVAQRAIEARDAGEPLDRLLRMREIAFEEDVARRERLVTVATRWFGHEGAIGPFSVRREAAAECAAATPR